MDDAVFKNLPEPSAPDRPRLALGPIIAASLLSAGFTAVCNVSHSPLAVTFGGLAVIALALPPLSVACERMVEVIFITGASVLAVIAVWLTLQIDWSQWFGCSAILAAYALALACTAFSLTRLGLPSIASAAIVVVASSAWLAWPIWLSPWLAGHDGLVGWLVFAHPLLTMNGVLIDQGIWTERPQMYGWTALNQDVSYSIPSGVLWCVIVHAGMAASLICGSFRYHFTGLSLTSSGS